MITETQTPEWINAVAASLAALAALGACATAVLQWRATAEQTRASLFSEKYAAYRALKDHLRKAYLHEGAFGDAQAAQDAAHKASFLFSTDLIACANQAVQLAWRVVEERQLSNDDGQRKASPHYAEMAAAARTLNEKMTELEGLFSRELSHVP